MKPTILLPSEKIAASFGTLCRFGTEVYDTAGQGRDAGVGDSELRQPRRSLQRGLRRDAIFMAITVWYGLRGKRFVRVCDRRSGALRPFVARSIRMDLRRRSRVESTTLLPWDDRFFG